MASMSDLFNTFLSFLFSHSHNQLLPQADFSKGKKHYTVHMDRLLTNLCLFVSYDLIYYYWIHVCVIHNFACPKKLQFL